jgi:hypothetical protein
MKAPARSAAMNQRRDRHEERAADVVATSTPTEQMATAGAAFTRAAPGRRGRRSRASTLAARRFGIALARARRPTTSQSTAAHSSAAHSSAASADAIRHVDAHVRRAIGRRAVVEVARVHGRRVR